MVFACSSGPGSVPKPQTAPGLRLVGEETDRIVNRLAAKVDGNARQPRYVAEGREVVTVSTGRRQTTPRAREALSFAVDGALSTNCEDLVPHDIAAVCDLIRAIRAAERNDLPPTPAQAQRAAA